MMMILVVGKRRRNKHEEIELTVMLLLVEILNMQY
jgi:hypothetical protein